MISDRRPTDAAVEKRQVSPDLFKIDKPVNQPQQVISRDMSFERELIEQRGLFDFPMLYHDLQSCQLDRLNHRYLCSRNSRHFQQSRP